MCIPISSTRGFVFHLIHANNGRHHVLSCKAGENIIAIILIGIPLMSSEKNLFFITGHFLSFLYVACTSFAYFSFDWAAFYY